MNTGPILTVNFFNFDDIGKELIASSSRVLGKIVRRQVTTRENNVKCEVILTVTAVVNHQLYRCEVVIDRDSRAVHDSAVRKEMIDKAYDAVKVFDAVIESAKQDEFHLLKGEISHG